MFCTTCGAQIPQGSAYCHNCGRPAVAASAPASSPTTGATPAAVSGAPQTDPKAILSLVLGLAGLFLFSIFAGIPAIVLGHMARARIRQSIGQLQGAGIALAGLILGYISVAIVPVIIFMLFFGVHSWSPLGRSTETQTSAWGGSDESSGAASVRQITVAAETYFAMYPHRGYPERL